MKNINQPIRAAAVPQKNGGGTAAPAPKDHHMKHSNIAALPQGHPFIREGIVRLNPAQAGAVFRDLGYEKNRDVERAQKHVAILAETMRRGLWLPRDQIAFARLGDRLIMINGHHRMAAQAASGVDIEWSIVIYPCQDEAEVAAIYARFDTNVRKRSAENIMSAMGLADALGVSATIAYAVWKAAPTLANNMQAGRKGDDFLARNIADDRFSVAVGFAAEAKAFEAAIKGASGSCRIRLMSGSVTSVALVTLRVHPSEAMLFWRGIADNDGLRRGDPRATLRAWLLESSGRGAPQAIIYATARAWNAFAEGKDLNAIRVTSTPIRIAGSSIVVSI